MNKRGVALLSGGLDSVLSGKILQMQGIEIFGFHLITPFFPLNAKKQQFMKVKKMANWLKIPLKIRYAGDEYLRIVEHPKFGWGKGINPCIDCRIMILKMAWKYAKEIDAGFLITGEVLGQRPMTQHLRALKTIEKRAGVQSLVVRPLSAKLLPPTIPEKLSIIDRERLLSIEGRSRTIQMQLAEEWKLKDYSSPGGGCLLTDPIYAKKLKYTLHTTGLDKNIVHLMKIGRHFILPDNAHFILGRNEKENNILKVFSSPGIIMEALNTPSPIGLLINGNNEKLASSILLGYTRLKEGEVEVKDNQDKRIINVIAMPKIKSSTYLLVS